MMIVFVLALAVCIIVVGAAWELGDTPFDGEDEEDECD